MKAIEYRNPLIPARIAAQPANFSKEVFMVYPLIGDSHGIITP
jgi:hypothetical protein